MKSIINITAVATILVLGGSIIACDLALGSAADSKPVPVLGKTAASAQPAVDAAVSTVPNKTELTVTQVEWWCNKEGTNPMIWNNWSSALYDATTQPIVEMKLSESEGDKSVIHQTVVTQRDFAFQPPKCPDGVDNASAIFFVSFGTAHAFPKNYQEFIRFVPGSHWVTSVPTNTSGPTDIKHLTPA